MTVKSGGNGSTKAGARRKMTLPGRSLMKERAYTEIKQAILNGDFSAGGFLAERLLAERLGMSKTPVRAALERLEAEGFVSISPQQGVVVRDLTVHEIADHYEIRVALETYVVRELAGRLTAEQRGRLHENLAAQAALDESQGAHAVQLDTEFHNLLCEFLGNAEILRVMGQLRERIHRVITKVIRINPTRIATSSAEHHAIADAILSGDAGSAARLIEEHLEYGKQCLLSPRRP